ncbi:MAG: cytidine deaminase [Oscillospiraceae bacterium]|nr:cytidine deaminase [Oscillospiraceae bacterium]
MVSKEELIALGWEAREKAYCPYSNYMVGAAVLGSNGKVYTGCNIENASYGLTVCAERVALFKMVSEGCRTFEAIAVCTGDAGKEGPPCLACRQVMTEFCANFDVPVYDCSPDGSVWEHTLSELAPLPFVSFDKNKDYHD